MKNLKELGVAEMDTTAQREMDGGQIQRDGWMPPFPAKLIDNYCHPLAGPNGPIL